MGWGGIYGDAQSIKQLWQLFRTLLFVEKSTLPTELAPDLQHFVRGSADLHIFTVRTKLVIFLSITLPEKSNQDHEPTMVVRVCVWVGSGLPTSNFQLSTSDLRSIPFYDNDNRKFFFLKNKSQKVHFAYI